MPKILISEKIDPICPQLFREAGFQLDHQPGLTPEELGAVIGEYEGLVVRSSTKVTADLIAKAAKLKVVGRAGAGVDTIDVPAATAAKILVMNTPGQNAAGVAELVIGLMLALVRHVVIGCTTLKGGLWEKNRLSGTEIGGKTLGLIGFGAVGRKVAALARGFGMTVLAHDPLLNDSQITAGGAKPASIADILAGADFVSLHLPKTKETANLINAETLAKMKKGAILINCARGGLVDEAALAAALKSGHLAGAAFDVFAAEPPAADNPLLALDNFIATPHLGASTAESQVNVAVAVARQMIAYFQSGALEGAVNSVS
ncbi:MAG: hydroxyacid dehydrogenase [Candidatus Adiutrix sp.]|jgi:D-3-phosphoglycerate dehydrogenase|nr:hydroxyacid dehydrogenase [Candidatus Adiutrix sp.]